MLLIQCPYCGERPEIEFSYGGQAHLARPARPAELSDDEWAAYLYLRDNHVRGCGRFFNALRDTTTDRFAGTYKTGESAP